MPTPSITRRGTAATLAALALTLVLVTLAGPATGAPPTAVRGADPSTAAARAASLKPSFKQLAGKYYGHTRSLRITKKGRARTVVYSGCCTEISDIKYRLTHLRKKGKRLLARATVKKVVYFNPDYGNAPQVGKRYRLRYRVPKDIASLAGLPYCGEDAEVGACGA
ncbi:hypothetical protein [Nocardioides sp. YIM 152588]|uniref:hypothetical protein n=1 Tax=Nocardioides sp. YIM 152588 TaxID=3158259 RepID=UPI0032E39298